MQTLAKANEVEHYKELDKLQRQEKSHLISGSRKKFIIKNLRVYSTVNTDYLLLLDEAILSHGIWHKV